MVPIHNELTAAQRLILADVNAARERLGRAKQAGLAACTPEQRRAIANAHAALRIAAEAFAPAPAATVRP